MKRLIILFLLLLGGSLPIFAQQKQALSAAATTCTVTGTSCLLVGVDSTQGGASFVISANASGNTIQFEASGDGANSWVALNVTPSNSTTAVTSATGTGTWKANVAGYTNVRMRMSTLVGGTTTVTITLSTASATRISQTGSSSTIPSSIAGLLIWYEGSQLTCTGGCSGTNAVTAFLDQSGNSNNAASCTGATYHASALNGLSGVDLASGGCTLASMIAWPGAETIFAVEKITSATAANGIIGYAGSNNCLYYRIGNTTTGIQNLLQQSIANIGNGTTAQAAGTYYQNNATYNSTTGAFAFRQGEAVNGSGTQAEAIFNPQVTFGQGSEQFGGTIVEFFMYNSVLTGPQITALEGYLNTKYGI